MRPFLFALALPGCALGWEPAGEALASADYDPGPPSEPISTCGAYDCPTPLAGFGDGAAMVIGTGKDCFVGFDEVDGAPIFQGPQGGFHVFVALRCREVGPYATLEHVLRDADTGEVYSLSDPLERTVELCDVGDGWGERARMYNYLDLFLEGGVESLVGKRVVIEASLHDDAGNAASATAETTLLDLVWWTDTQY